MLTHLRRSEGRKCRHKLTGHRRCSTIANGQGANTALPIYGFYMNAAYADESLGLSQADFVRPEGMGLDSLDCRQLMELNQATFGGSGAGFDDDDLFQ